MRKFNWSGLSLNEGSFRIQSTNLFDAAEVQVATEDLARDDGLVQLYERLGGRQIEFSGYLRTESQEAADAAIDLLKKRLTYISGGIGAMTVDFPEGDRVWQGKVINKNISRGSTDVSRAGFSFVLQTPKPYGSSAAGLQEFAEAQTITASAITQQVNNIGTYLAKPLVTLTVNAASDAAVEFRIGNPETGQYVSFSVANLQIGDAITIDCDIHRIFHNSEEIRPFGVFPSWLPELGLIEYNDSMSSREVVMSTQFIPRYL